MCCNLCDFESFTQFVAFITIFTFLLATSQDLLYFFCSSLLGCLGSCNSLGEHQLQPLLRVVVAGLKADGRDFFALVRHIGFFKKNQQFTGWSNRIDTLSSHPKCALKSFLRQIEIF